MNFVSLFTREEAIAGVEIGDTYVRAAVFVPSKNPKEPSVLSVTEEPLTAITVEDGRGVGEAALVAALQKVVRKLPIKIRYAVVTVPTGLSFSKLFVFPHSVTGRKLEDTMRLTVGFQLPVKPDEVFLDWEKIEQGEQNKIFLVAARRETIASYLAALGKAGIKPVALEIAPLSLARAMENPDEGAVLTAITRQDGVEFAVVSKGTIRFIRTVPKTFIPTDKDVEEEKRKITDYYESEMGEKIVARADSRDMKLCASYRLPAGQESNAGAWATVVGAAVRGILPRSEDEFISLLSVNTRVAYEHQKALVFAEFMTSLNIGASAFFVIAFAGAWILMMTLQRQAAARVQHFATFPMPEDAVQVESNTAKFNAVLGFAEEIIKTSPQWSVFFERMQKLVPEGISVTNLAVSDPAIAITLSGVAKDRAALAVFRKNVDTSDFTSGAVVPATNLQLRANIPFSMTFTISDPSVLYVR